MKLTSCQRCGSGNLDQTGIPRRTTPFEPSPVCRDIRNNDFQTEKPPAKRWATRKSGLFGSNTRYAAILIIGTIRIELILKGLVSAGRIGLSGFSSLQTYVKLC